MLEATKDDRLAALWVTAVGIGLRKGELLALRWSDVGDDTVAIRHTLQRGQLAEPETERSRRTVVMPAMVREALREHRRRQLEDRLAAGARWTDHDYVFASEVGTPLDPRNVTRMYAAALGRAGLPQHRLHDLRHGCATLLVEQGEELAVVSRILGHSSISTTADVYAHLTRGMQDRAAQRMDGILRRTG